MQRCHNSSHLIFCVIALAVFLSISDHAFDLLLYHLPTYAIYKLLKVLTTSYNTIYTVYANATSIIYNSLLSLVIYTNLIVSSNLRNTNNALMYSKHLIFLFLTSLLRKTRL